MTVNVQLQKPTGGGSQDRVGPGMFIARCSRITDAPPYENEPQMYWYWNLYYTENNSPKTIPASSLNDDGTEWEYRDKTSTKFGKNPKTGNAAKARSRVEACLAREIRDDEPLDGLLDQCIGKPAVLHLIEKPNGYLDISHVEPYRKGMLCPRPMDVADGEESEAPF